MIWADLQLAPLDDGEAAGKGLFFSSYTPCSIKAPDLGDDAEDNDAEDQGDDVDFKHYETRLDELFAPIWKKLREPDEFELECGNVGLTPRPEELVQKKMRPIQGGQHARKSQRIRDWRAQVPRGFIRPHAATPREWLQSSSATPNNAATPELLSEQLATTRERSYSSTDSPASPSSPFARLRSKDQRERSVTATPRGMFRPRSVCTSAPASPRSLARLPCSPDPSRPHTSCATSTSGPQGIPRSRRPLPPALMPCLAHGVPGSPAPPAYKLTAQAQAKQASETSAEVAKQPAIRRVQTIQRSARDEQRERERDEEQKRALDAVIKQSVGGAAVETSSVQEVQLPAERQTTYRTDNIQASRELNGLERGSITDVFKDMVSSVYDDKHAEWNKVKIPWTEIARRLRGRLSSAQIQRLGIYLKIPKFVTHIRYLERVSTLVAASKYDRLRMCFSLLDADGDAAIGHRDIFACLGSTTMGVSRSAQEGPLDVCFAQPGAIGVTLKETELGRLEVKDLEVASRAEQAGVRVGDFLTHVNGQDMDTVPPDTARQLLSGAARPLRLQFYRGPCDAGMFKGPDFEKLLKSLQSRERVGLKVTVVGAKGLRNTDPGVTGKSDPYCACEIHGKPHTKFTTKVVSDCLDPVWNDTRYLPDFQENDSIKFTVYDRDIGTKADESLGHCTLSGKKVLPHGIDAEPNLLDAGKGITSTLKIKISLLPRGGMGFAEFKSVFSDAEPGFLNPLIQELTGLTVKRVDRMRSKTFRAMKLRVTLIGAQNLRNADPGGKSDPYCTCELVGKPQTRTQTRVVMDTLDPVWNERRELAGFTEEDNLRFMVYDKDTGTKPDDVLGYITLNPEQFYPKGFDGELKLSGGGKGFNPTLEVKVSVLGANNDNYLSAEEKAALAKVAETGRTRHREELRDLRARRPWLSKPDIEWYLRTFHRLRGDDSYIHKETFAKNASKLFGLPLAFLAERIFDLLDENRFGTIGIKQWAVMLEGLSRGNSFQKLSIAFNIYDLDGDGVISLDDSLNLAREEEALFKNLKEAGEVPSSADGDRIIEEMQGVHNFVSDGSDDIETKNNKTMDVWWFQEIYKEPAIVDVLLKNLKALGEGDVVSDCE